MFLSQLSNIILATQTIVASNKEKRSVLQAEYETHVFPW